MKVEYENHYLSDKDVANFARQSFGKLAENFTDEQNDNLIRFLARGMTSGDWDKLLDTMVNLDITDGALNNMEPSEIKRKAKELAVYLRSIPEHWVPFGHPQISLRMQVPVPIARQLFKHKIGMVESEESRRYVSGTPTLFIPDTFRGKAANVKQGSGDTHPDSDAWRVAYIDHCNEAIDMYDNMIAAGVCPEQARFILPQGVEVQWLWTGSLYAMANIYNQRRPGGHAQKETQWVAEQIDKIIRPLFPVAWSALVDGAY
ncbi:MAG TPA: FAD-dependent thymidylate synthase [Candidatus Acidoferrum sp.]|nr:FAD-dependent thymidylate synthase [Candidatus Acidoferrum sp.]